MSKTVFTNGCFDLLHVGHLRYLQEARELGSKLIVGLNSDASVKRLKGEQRPIVPQDERREMLLGIKPVDEVIIFDEDTPLRLIQEVCPDILVKGGDWPVSEIVGSDFVLKNNGQVLSLPFHEGRSSTNIIAKIQSFKS